MQMESLKKYIIIDSVSKHIRIAKHEPDSAWKFLELSGDNDELFIQTIQQKNPLKDIYEGI